MPHTMIRIKILLNLYAGTACAHSGPLNGFTYASRNFFRQGIKRGTLRQ